MKSFLDRRFTTFLVGILTVFLLVLLASGIDALEFKKGTPFSYSEVEVSENSVPVGTPNLSAAIILSVVIISIVTIFLLVVATRKQRRILILMLLGIVLILVGLMWWISRAENGEDVFTPTSTRTFESQYSHDPTSVPDISQPSVEYTPPPISPWISIVITFGILLVVAGLAWFFFRQRLRSEISLDAIAGIAEEAIVDLESGRDYGDSVINCYAKMINAVNKQRGIRRSGNLTPEEFISVLERALLPSEPVRRLTALFTRVRYGGKTATRREIEEAIQCLTDIVSSIREVQ